jgi:hypothetical protein
MDTMRQLTRQAFRLAVGGVGTWAVFAAAIALAMALAGCAKPSDIAECQRGVPMVFSGPTSQRIGPAYAACMSRKGYGGQIQG